MASADLPTVFARLRAVMASHAAGLNETADGPTGYQLDRAPDGRRAPAAYFGGVRLGKRYVSYYLMPIYERPTLLEGISPELRRRMQGKSCFNFSAIDEALFTELDALTATSRAAAVE